MLEDSEEDSSDFEEDEPCIRDAALDSHLQSDINDLDLNSSSHSENNFSDNLDGKVIVKIQTPIGLLINLQVP